jgi:peptidoglycan/xylan/chitin deacetylase (PgdA/CDA1 family)
MSRSGSIILCYHRVADVADDPLQLCVSLTNFSAHLDLIARHGEPSTLAERDLPSRRPRVVVTLDDGYADNLLNALPIAEAKGIPVTVYVTSGAVGRQRGFWWDRLVTLLRSRPSGVATMALPTPDGTIPIGLGSSKLAEDFRSVRRHLKPLPVADIHHALDSVAEVWGVDASPPKDARTLTSSELAQLASSDVVTIGAHTTDHVCLRGQPTQEQKANIASSKEELERLSGGPVTHFAYPFGTVDSFDDDSVDAVRATGFETACTTIPANARSTSDPHRLPRRLVMDWGRLRFRAGFERWRLVTEH